MSIKKLNQPSKDSKPTPKKVANKKKDTESELFGYKKWCREYVKSAPPPIDHLCSDIEAFMLDYDQKKLKEKEQKALNEPDEDGWVTVSSSNKTPSNTKSEEKKKKRKHEELLNFYNFQKKSAKYDNIKQLQDRLEVEKERIKQMKNNRKFKPF